MRTVTSVVALALLAGCGSSAGGSAKPQSFEAALGLDQASMKAREAKIQEAIRKCMKEQGFDYVPSSSDQMRFSFGPGSDGPSSDPKFKRTKGYGITTTFGEGPPGPRDSSDDPNSKIRDALSDEDKKAYDIALHGETQEDAKDATGPRGGGMVIRRETGGPGKDGGGPDFSSMGCFGKAEKEVPGGPAELGSSLKDLFSRVENDPRVVSVNADWRTCMSKAGYDQFNKQNDIPDYLFGKLQQLTNSPDNTVRMDGDIDQDALSALQHEELTIARADDDCDKKVGLTKTTKKVRDEAEQRFLDEHPNLTAGK